MPDALDTNAKALRINLDPFPYGTFAEIGGGQEVSRWFFRVGGAAGTVAKTMSAYDMTVSDAIYGAGPRYVSRERLRAMLEHEFALLRARLSPARGDKTGFFVFADTVSTRNFKGTNECHGWIGLRMQHAAGADPSDLLVHVSLLDPTALQQQQALGTLGVNMMYAAYYLRDDRGRMLRSLMDGLTIDNLEIDVIECSGPAFPECLDGPALALEMLEQGLTHAVVFDEKAIMDQPSTVFRKRGLLVHRCSLVRDNPELDRMLDAAAVLLKGESPEAERDPLPLLELSITGPPGGGEPDLSGVQQRLAGLLQSGRAVLVTGYSETFRISTYLRRFSQEPVRFVIGVDTVIRILRDGFTAGISGDMLEGLGRLLAPGVRLYVFSMPLAVFRGRLEMSRVDPSFCRAPDKPVISVADVQVASPASHLLDFLRDAGWVLGADLPAR